MTMEVFTRLDGWLDKLLEQLVQKLGSCERTHRTADHFAPREHTRDYHQNPYIPPWAVGSGLGGLLMPPPDNNDDPFAPDPNDPEPTNTGLPPDDSGGG